MHTANIFVYIILYIPIYEVNDMKKFKIPSVPPTTNKCIRFPNDIIAQVEERIKGSNCTFTAFVIEAVRVALESLEEESEG